MNSPLAGNCPMCGEPWRHHWPFVHDDEAAREGRMAQQPVGEAKDCVMMPPANWGAERDLGGES